MGEEEKDELVTRREQAQFKERDCHFSTAAFKVNRHMIRLYPLA